MLPCKRFKCDNQEDEPWSKTTCLSSTVSTQSLADGTPTDCTTIISENIGDLTQFISIWSDTQSTGKRVLLHLQSTETIRDILLRDNINKKFLQFHHDITEECGTEDKQHSWAVIEKKQEVVLYGPYYPNYNSGKHSEDIIIRQTEELLKSTDAGEDWMVYLFTMNSPCLSRNKQTPCMLKLVEKAKEWWSRFRLKTNIGYNKCWGFKGTKETMFRAVNFSQLEAVHQSENYQQYVSQKLTGEDLLCKNVYTLLDNLLKRGPFTFHLSQVGEEWRSYFKGMQTIAESVQPDEKEVVKHEITRMTEEVKSLLTKACMNVTDHMERGHALALDLTFDSRVSKGTTEELKRALETCWKDMVQDKYAETLRDILTEDFNKCTNLLFINDFVTVTSSFLHIGRIHCENEKQEN